MAPCHYGGNLAMGSCTQVAEDCVWMRAKGRLCCWWPLCCEFGFCRGSKPKQRTVCTPCRSWLCAEQLAELVVDCPPLGVCVFLSPVISDKLCSTNFVSWCSGETAVDKVVLASVKDACYYHERCKYDCDRVAVGSVWMRGKRSSPKERLVCGVCLAWLSDNGLADSFDAEPTARP